MPCRTSTTYQPSLDKCPFMPRFDTFFQLIGRQGDITSTIIFTTRYPSTTYANPEKQSEFATKGFGRRNGTVLQKPIVKPFDARIT